MFYGKIAKKPIGAAWLTIPKTRFKDMYTTGLICVLIVYAEVIHSLILGGKIPEKNLRVLDIFGGVDNGIGGKKQFLCVMKNITTKLLHSRTSFGDSRGTYLNVDSTAEEIL